MHSYDVLSGKLLSRVGNKKYCFTLFHCLTRIVKSARDQSIGYSQASIFSPKPDATWNIRGTYETLSSRHVHSLGIYRRTEEHTEYPKTDGQWISVRSMRLGGTCPLMSE